MFLQGDLQSLFDALYQVGAIDPVLKMDWNSITREMNSNPNTCEKLFTELNQCGTDRELLIQKLEQLDSRLLNFIAIEVAREFCEFQDRTTLH